MPINGKRTNGSKATTGMGSASVIHQPIMRNAIANTFDGSGSMPKGLNANIKRSKKMPPMILNKSNCFALAGLTVGKSLILDEFQLKLTNSKF